MPPGEGCVTLRIHGARQHNLTGFDLALDPRQLTVFCGRSGSGKSSLAFDTLHAEGQRRYLESLSTRVRQAVGSLPRPSVDAITGLPPTVALAQRSGRARADATVARLADLELAWRVIFSRGGVQHDPVTGEPIVPVSHDVIVDRVTAMPDGTRVLIESPVRVRSDLAGVVSEIARAGFSRVRLGGQVMRLEDVDPGAPAEGLRIVVDRVRLAPGRRARVEDALRTASRAGQGQIVVVAGEEELAFVDRPYSEALDRVLPELRPSLFRAGGPDPCATCEGTGRVERVDCTTCSRTGMGEAARAVRLHGRRFVEVMGTPLSALRDEVAAWPEDLATEAVRAELQRRLDVLVEVGLGYLTPGGRAEGLSGGEAQRLRLARQVASELSGVLVVLDEPTAGLAVEQVRVVISLLRRLLDAGNGVVVVEHHPEVIRAADRVIEFGPGVGHAGGRVVFDGAPEVLARGDTPTGRALRGEVPQPAGSGASGEGDVVLRGCTWRNLLGEDVPLLRSGWTALVGPSGAGKTSVLEAVAGLLSEGPYPGTLDGADGLLRVLDVDAADVRRSRRSMPATYVGLWDTMRSLLAQTTEAQVRGFDAGSFSLSKSGGRCEHCEGHGERRIELGYLPPVHVVCEVCDGRRFARDLLEVTWKGKNAAELLALDADEGLALLAGHPKLDRALRALRDVGLGYLTLGQPAHTLSGGEARRLKLGRELVRAYKGDLTDTVLLLDAPAVGLHPMDVAGLTALLRRLVDEGATVVTATQSPLVADAADRVVVLGPGPGPDGGRVTEVR